MNKQSAPLLPHPVTTPCVTWPWPGQPHRPLLGPPLPLVVLGHLCWPFFDDSAKLLLTTGTLHLLLLLPGKALSAGVLSNAETPSEDQGLDVCDCATRLGVAPGRSLPHSGPQFAPLWNGMWLD